MTEPSNLPLSSSVGIALSSVDGRRPRSAVDVERPALRRPIQLPDTGRSVAGRRRRRRRGRAPCDRLASSTACARRFAACQLRERCRALCDQQRDQSQDGAVRIIMLSVRRQPATLAFLRPSGAALQVPPVAE